MFSDLLIIILRISSNFESLLKNSLQIRFAGVPSCGQLLSLRGHVSSHPITCNAGLWISPPVCLQLCGLPNGS